MKYYYMLDKDGKVVVTKSTKKWATWYEVSQEQRVVAKTQIGSSLVSTVFLAIDHNLVDAGLPVLWETMVFGGALTQECERYKSREDAIRGHAVMCQRVRELQETA